MATLIGLNVKSVAFSRDGTQIVSGSEAVRLWDASTGQQVNVLYGHVGRVNSVGFSSDGTRIVSSSDDKSIRVWDASTGQQLNVIYGHNRPVNSVAFSTDGTRIVSGSDDKSICVWDLLLGDHIHHMYPPHIGEAAFDWTQRSDNWIVSGEGGLIMWLPQSVPLQKRYNSLAISNEPRVSFHDFPLGDNWADCYTP